MPEKNPTESQILSDLHALRLQRNFVEAEASAAVGLGIFPNSVKLLNERALVYQDQKEQAKAMADLERTLAIDPDNEFAFRWKCFVLRSQRKFQEAEEAITVALNRLPNNVRLLNERGWLYQDQRRYEEAVAAFE